jgi:nitrate reductase (NAD(P)H)
MNHATDCTEDFNAIHSIKARQMLSKYLVGTLYPTEKLNDSDDEDIHAFQSKNYSPFLLSKRIVLTHDTRLLTFSKSPNSKPFEGFPTGKHVYIRHLIDCKLLIIISPFT